jgi:hypothetical protein
MTNEGWLKWAIARYYRSHGYKVRAECQPEVVARKLIPTLPANSYRVVDHATI